VNLIRSGRSSNLPRQAIPQVSVFLVFVLLTLWCPALWAQAPASAPEERKQIEDAVKKFMAANSLPSVSVAVVRDGKYEWSSGFGMADLENSVPATSRTLYRLASISKPITATAAMLLYERGKLDLDACRCRSTVLCFLRKKRPWLFTGVQNQSEKESR
jgi:beta-lactamase family protein